MMSDLKIHTGNQELIDGMKVSDVFRSIGDIKFSPSMSDRKCLVVARAVRDYDKNQELIAKLQDRIESQLALLGVSGKRIKRLESENKKQAERIEMLVKAATAMIEACDRYNQGEPEFSVAYTALDEALAATTKG